MSDDQNRPKTKDYEVGYGRPPKSTQFKPGQSGNPRGRKKKPKSIQDQMRNELARRVTVTEDGVRKRVTLQEVCFRTIVNKAAKGDIRAAKFALALSTAPEYAERENLIGDELSEDDRALLEEILKESEEQFGEKMAEVEGLDLEPEPAAAPVDTPPPVESVEAPPPPPRPPEPPVEPTPQTQPQPEPKEQSNDPTTPSSPQPYRPGSVQSFIRHK